MSNASKAGQTWTKEDEAYLLANYYRPQDIPTLAFCLGRSHLSIEMKIKALKKGTTYNQSKEPTFDDIVARALKHI